ncbi:hypothetical protein [Streptomyces sp. V2I9]|uniref:hypothetical protein n=1 Tax=Streptomyces sp. V2I9 TaxID=3042304 RepID=UPI002781D35E|nr:hypothetical protein [Streptomyces sp. V2I9]MDQ0986666.1 hypothetical protein [Streptomyces sp. V2I9]
MGVEAQATNERVTGRTWTVRLDPAGRGRADVRVSCSRPACAAQTLPSAAAGRTAAVEHLKAHLRTGPAPRSEAYCACRAAECHTHIRPAGPRERPAPWRCGGAVVLAVVADREGRWWQVMECCSRCAAAHPTAKVVATAPPPDRTVSDRPAPGRSAPEGPALDGAAPGRPVPAADPFQVAAGPVPNGPAFAPHFSHSTPAPAAASREVPAPRPARTARSARPVRRRPACGRIAQRFVPHDLRPISLRDELTELGELFRAYQQRDEPDLALLAELHERKAEAFAAWAEITFDPGLRLDAQRAEQAAAAARLQHLHRSGQAPDGEGPAVARLLTAQAQWDQARAVLAHVADHAPLPGPEARLLVLMLTLRTAQSGVGNLVGQDVKGLPLSDPEHVVGQLVECGWLELPGSVDELMASRPESPTRISVPSLTPREDDPGPFTFGRKLRPRLSGWAQRVVGEKKLRKAKTGADARLLALALATQVYVDGYLGPEGDGIDLESLVSWCAIAPDALPDLVDRLTTTGWLEEPEMSDGLLTGILAERVLPFTCPLT